MTAYAARAEGSLSKLNTFRDGWRILRTMIQLYRVERPLWFFGFVAALIALSGAILGIPVVSTYLETGLVPRFPTLIMIVGMGVLAALCLLTGLILDTVTRGRQEMKRLAYLSHPASGHHHEKVVKRVEGNVVTS